MAPSSRPGSRPGGPASEGHVGKYQLIQRLAVGGMAEIFLARATGIEGFEKLVVLKRILPQLSNDVHFVRMFLQEARLAATLHHSNIAQVYDIGRVYGSYFFTMEYIHGVDLRHLFRAAKEQGRTIPLEHALSIMVATAAGLHYAHEKRDSDGQALGLVHRDVSPSNVLCDYDGGVKVVDFGIAKATYQRSATRPGTIKGKIAYMSPEQCQNEALDRRSDIFAIGILLYELSTGTLLFDGESELAVLRQIVDREIPPPSSRCLGYSPELEKIVMRALCKNRDERYATALDLQLALEDFARERRLGTSSARLAAFLKELFGADLEGWRRAERDGISLGDFMTATSGGWDESTSLDLAKAGTVEVLFDSGLLESDAPRPPMAPSASGLGTRRLVRTGLLLGVAAVAAMGAYVVYAPSTRSPPVLPVPEIPLAKPSPPEAAAPKTVALRLLGLPEGARVMLDGRPLSKFPITTERSTVQHRLVVSAPGREDKEIEVVPISDLDLHVDLRPIAQAPAPKQKGRAAKRPRPALVPVQTPAPASPPGGVPIPARVENSLVDPLSGKK